MICYDMMYLSMYEFCTSERIIVAKESFFLTLLLYDPLLEWSEMDWICSGTLLTRLDLI